MAAKNRLICLLALPLALIVFAANAQEEPDWTEFDTTVSVPDNVDDATYLDVDPEPVRRRTSLRRHIMREDVTIRVKTLRLNSGKKVQLVYGAPKSSKNCPAVFVLDIESNVMANAKGLGLSRGSKQQRQEQNEAGYLLRSPFGSNILGNGFAVAYVVAEDLETLRSARTADWIGLFDRVRNHKQVDSNSMFLFSTREWANTALFLATKYDFSGFILEEPSYLLFSRNTYEDVIERSHMLTSEEIWRRTDPSREQKYFNVLSGIRTPIMLIRNKNSAAYDFNEKTLIPKLLEANTYFESVNINGPSRSLTIFGGHQGVLKLAPEVAYFPRNVTDWVEEMIGYMRENSNSEAIALRDPARFRSW